MSDERVDPQVIAGAEAAGSPDASVVSADSPDFSAMIRS